MINICMGLFEIILDVENNFINFYDVIYVLCIHLLSTFSI